MTLILVIFIYFWIFLKKKLNIVQISVKNKT
jgi:hypothetical protein